MTTVIWVILVGPVFGGRCGAEALGLGLGLSPGPAYRFALPPGLAAKTTRCLVFDQGRPTSHLHYRDRRTFNPSGAVRATCSFTRCCADQGLFDCLKRKRKIHPIVDYGNWTRVHGFFGLEILEARHTRERTTFVIVTRIDLFQYRTVSYYRFRAKMHSRLNEKWSLVIREV